jgi:hypothetical protein
MKISQAKDWGGIEKESDRGKCLTETHTKYSSPGIVSMMQNPQQNIHIASLCKSVDIACFN